MNDLCRQCGRPSRRDMARGYCPVTAKSIPKFPPDCRFFIDVGDRASKRPRERGKEHRNVR